MLYLLGQIWLWLLAAFILGWASHWLLSSGKGKQQTSNKKTEVTTKIEVANIEGSD